MVTIPSFTRATADRLRKAVRGQPARDPANRLTCGERSANPGAPAASLHGKGTHRQSGLAKSHACAPGGAAKLWTGRTVVLMDDATGGAAGPAAAPRPREATTGEGTVGMAIVQRLVPTQSGGTLFMTVGRYIKPSAPLWEERGSRPTGGSSSSRVRPEGRDPRARPRSGARIGRSPRGEAIAFPISGRSLLRSPLPRARSPCTSRPGRRPRLLFPVFSVSPPVTRPRLPSPVPGFAVSRRHVSRGAAPRSPSSTISETTSRPWSALPAGRTRCAAPFFRPAGQRPHGAGTRGVRQTGSSPSADGAAQFADESGPGRRPAIADRGADHADTRERPRFGSGRCGRQQSHGLRRDGRPARDARRGARPGAAGSLLPGQPHDRRDGRARDGPRGARAGRFAAGFPGRRGDGGRSREGPRRAHSPRAARARPWGWVIPTRPR